MGAKSIGDASRQCKRAARIWDLAEVKAARAAVTGARARAWIDLACRHLAGSDRIGGAPKADALQALLVCRVHDRLAERDNLRGGHPRLLPAFAAPLIALAAPISPEIDVIMARRRRSA